MKNFVAIFIAASRWTRTRVSLSGLVYLSAVAWSCSEARAEGLGPTPTPEPIPAGTASSGVIRTLSFPAPNSASAFVSVDIIDEPNADALGNLKVIAYPGPPFNSLPPPDVPVVFLWNHEHLLNANHAVHLIANLPFGGDICCAPDTFSYTIQAIDDRPGFLTGFVGKVNTVALTLNPSNPGHAGLPILNLSEGPNNEPVPANITFGHSLSLLATAIGNPSSYKIARLGLTITEVLNDDTLQNHNSGLGPGVYAPLEIMQSATSNSVLKLRYTPPILPPGNYKIVVTALDTAGFSNTLSRNLTVTRLFGFFSVSNINRTPDSDCSACQCASSCVTTHFSATLNLANHTAVASGNLRIRLLSVAGSAFRQDQDPPQLDPPVELSGASIGQVTPLLPGASEHVVVSGIAPAPVQQTTDSGIGFQIYALLEKSSGNQWIKVDSIKVTEGVWPHAGMFNGPGGGTTAVRPGIGGSTLSPQIKLFKNISTRCRVLTGDNVLIAGFIVKGTVAEKVILRAIGPSLTQFSGPLADPILELHKPDGSVITNDNWRDSQAAEIQATGIPPANNRESAIVATLEPNKAYSAIMRGKNNGTGIGLVELYDLGTTTDSQAVNISSRGFIETGNDVMIGGIIVGGSGRVLARAIGPSLPASIANRLQDPVLTLRNADGTLVASNDNWRTNQAAIQATGAAPTNDRESAIVTTLLPGRYTAIVSGKNNTTGVGLVECYNVQ